MLCFGILIMFCQPQSQPAPPDTFCQIAKPILWSATDTRVTKEQVDTHNRKWKALCQKAKP